MSRHYKYGVVYFAGVDAEAARNEEERVMLEDAKGLLNLNNRDKELLVHPKTGASPLHVAAAKGYIKVVQCVYF